MSAYTIETYRELSPHDQQEWVLSNGIGGYASSTVVGMNTRKYHGLLIAATLPPVGRVMTVNRIGEIIEFDGAVHEFSVNAFDGAIHPRGNQYLTKFELSEAAQWEYDVAGVAVTKEMHILWGCNTAAVRYSVDSGDRPFKLSLRPMVSLRDFHSIRRSPGHPFKVDRGDRVLTVLDGDNHVTITADAGQFVDQPDWWFGHLLPVETERGQDNHEDLFTPGPLVVEGNGRLSVTIWFSTDEDPCRRDWTQELSKRRVAVMAAKDDAENVAPDGAAAVWSPRTTTTKRLMRAANDFIVARKTPDGKPGTSVIAGYPWFADWGRDTMISLPGLLLVPGRFHQAREVLTVFSQYVDGGMIPNKFNDYTNEPEYNTVDASLWFVHACFEYARLAHDHEVFESILKPACRKIIDGYRDGTRYHIGMDPVDGLIHQGDAQTQLTWMDAKCGDIAFTPRQGKPVEINALWYHALVLMGEADLAEKVRAGFEKFWIDEHSGLADVIDGDRRDEAIRPNQIFAVSLPNSPLSPDRQSAVVAVVQRELLTPVGLRSLARTDPGYIGHYYGPQFDRDKAYHNGTVWGWLIGPFLDAYLKTTGRSAAGVAQARQWLEPLIVHMSDSAAIGQISEIFEGDEPHRPVGCCAQAWSVAEVLRLAVDLGM